MNMTIERLNGIKKQLQANRDQQNRYRCEHQAKVDEYTLAVNHYDKELVDLDASLTLLKAGALISDETKGAGQ